MESPISAKAAILVALRDGPGFGLDLIRRLRTRSGGLVRLRQGSVYPALRALERNGLLRSWEVMVSRRGGRPRRYYELTPRGIAVANRQREAISALLRPGDAPLVSERQLGEMRDRLDDCAELSDFAAQLRDSVSAQSVS